MGLNWLKKDHEEDESPKPRRQHYDMPNGEKAVFNRRGLIPVILQEAQNMMTLHLGYMDRWALDTTLQEGTVYIYRRSSNKLEKFGEKKGLEYKVKSIILNSTRRALLVLVICEDGKSAHSSFDKVCYPVQKPADALEDAFISATADSDSIFPEIDPHEDSFWDDLPDDTSEEDKRTDE